MVTFSVSVHNTSPEAVTLDALVDDVYGNLDGKGTCATGGSIAPDAAYSCAFDESVTGNAGSTHKDTVTATVSDDEQNEASASHDATVTILDNSLPLISVDKTASPDSLPATGGSVTFTVVVTNHSIEPVTITSLMDDVYGNLDGVGSCAIGALLAPDESYTCSFVKVIPAKAGAHVDVVTAIAVDDEQHEATAHDDAVVTVAKAAPSGEVEGTSGTPHVTPPPTDVAGAPAQPGDSGLPILAAVVALGLLLLMTTPRRALARVRVRNR
jgi:hypothetical protein